MWLVNPIFGLAATILIIIIALAKTQESHNKHGKFTTKPKTVNFMDVPTIDTGSMYMSAEAKQAHLASNYWKELKLKRLIKANYMCEVHGCTETHRLELHHETYQRLGQEKLSDIKIICRQHHQATHDELGYSRETYYPIKG